VSPRVVSIHSENSAYQHFETLKKNRVKRTRHREFFVEGVRPIELALAASWPLRALLYPRGRKLSSWAHAILDQAAVETLVELPAELFAKLSDKNHPGELLAIARMLPDSTERIGLPDPESLLVIVCDRPSSPGNLGTLIRSADAFGVDAVLVTGHAADPWDPLCIRASLGCIFTRPVLRLGSATEVIAWAATLRQQHPRVELVGTSARGTEEIAQHDWQGPRVLFFGSETDGLCRAYRDAVDATVTIPMFGSASSLNVAVAGSIVLYEISRQRQALRMRAT
jgi:TrmH family RNA methyltransferase